MSSPYRSLAVIHLCTACKHVVQGGSTMDRWAWDCAAHPTVDPLSYVAGADLPLLNKSCTAKRDGPTCPDFEAS